MKNKFILILVVGVGLLGGCSTMNQNFTCNKTAIDSCRSIADVYHTSEMIEGLRDKHKVSRQSAHKIRKEKNNIAKRQQIWIAPFEDTHGVYHEAEVIHAPGVVV